MARKNERRQGTYIYSYWYNRTGHIFKDCSVKRGKEWDIISSLFPMKIVNEALPLIKVYVNKTTQLNPLVVQKSNIINLLCSLKQEPLCVQHCIDKPKYCKESTQLWSKWMHHENRQRTKGQANYKTSCWSILYPSKSGWHTSVDIQQGFQPDFHWLANDYPILCCNRHSSQCTQKTSLIAHS